MGARKLKVYPCGCQNISCYCPAATARIRFLPCFSISVSRFLITESETPDFDDLSNQKVHRYTFKRKAAVFPGTPACLLHGFSDSTVLQAQLWCWLLPGGCSQEPPRPPNPISVALGDRESFAFVIRCLC